MNAQERRRADIERRNVDQKLTGLYHTGRAIDSMRDYHGKDRDLKGISARIKRIESGQEKV